MHSIRWRLMLTYLAVTLLTTLALGVSLIRAVERSYVDERLQVLQAHADMVKQTIAGTDLSGNKTEALVCLCKRLSQCLRTRLVLSEMDGRRLVDTATEGGERPGESPMAALAPTRSAGAVDGSGDTSIAAQGVETPKGAKPCAPDRFHCQSCHGGSVTSSKLHLTVTVGAGGRAYLLTVTAPGTGLEHIMARIHTATLLAALAALLIVGLISTRLATGISAPLAHMNRMARRMAEGDLEQRVEVGSRDEVGQLAASFNDMSERIRRGMNAVAEEKSKLETVLAQMADGIIVTDTGAGVAVFNPACERLFGIPAASILGQQVYGATFNPDLQRAITRALAGETVVEEVRLLHPQPIVLGVHASPFRDAEGLTQGAIVVLQDRTEMRRAAELQRDFIGNASHELRTPVASLQATVDTLLDGAKDDPTVRDRFIETLSRETGRLSVLLADLLDLSRLEAAAPVEKTPLRVAEVVRDVLDMAGPQLAARKLDVASSVPEELSVPAERTRLTQVLANLLDNAIKYTPDGGQVRLTAAQEDGCVRIAVADTGPGIPEAEQERVFERFYRVDKARSRALGGTGLGLAIAREAVALHGGTLTLESTPGQGTTFTVSLPTA